MGEEYDFFADPRNDAFAYNDLGASPSNSQILSDINYSPSMLSSLGSLLSGGSGSMAQIASLGGLGALLNSLGGSSGGGYKGYQGSIPKYTAQRTMNPIPTTTTNAAGQTVPRRPGSGGISYFSPMVYTPQAAAPAAAAPAETAPATVAPAVEDKSYQVFAAGGMAHGGLGSLGHYSDGGHLLKGPGDGVSDSIPAMIGDKQPARLADGEFVIPARIVSEIGNGSTDAGARKLYAMMDRIQKARGKTLKNVAANTKADKHLPA
jgi:hypothetical protein